MIGPVVVFPDVEAFVINYLATNLPTYGWDGVDVTNREANPRPPRSVIVRNDGGPGLDVIRRSTLVGVRVYAETDADASDLAELVAGLLAVCPDGPNVVASRHQSGPIAVPDEATPLRYLVVELTTRGARFEPTESSSA